MNAIETLIYTLETQLKTMPSGYVKETVTACKELAEGIKEIYENPNNVPSVDFLERLIAAHIHFLSLQTIFIFIHIDRFCIEDRWE